MTQISLDKKTVIKEIIARHSMNIAQAQVTCLVYCFCLIPILYPIFLANFSTNGVSRNDNANMKHMLRFIKTGYNFRKMSLLYITNPKPNNNTHKNIHTFLLRINETAAPTNNKRNKKCKSMLFFNATNTIKGYSIVNPTPRILMIFINDFFNSVNHIL